MAVESVATHGPVRASLRYIAHTVLTADATTVSFTGLVGNQQGTFFYVANVLNDSGSDHAFVVRPNAATTTYKAGYIEQNGATVASASLTAWRAGTSRSGRTSLSHGYIWARTGQMRSYSGVNAEEQAAVHVQTVFSGDWDDGASHATEIIRLDFVAGVALGFNVGSRFELYYVTG